METLAPTADANFIQRGEEPYTTYLEKRNDVLELEKEEEFSEEKRNFKPGSKSSMRKMNSTNLASLFPT